jgi:hypothetical protein
LNQELKDLNDFIASLCEQDETIHDNRFWVKYFSGQMFSVCMKKANGDIDLAYSLAEAAAHDLVARFKGASLYDD